MTDRNTVAKGIKRLSQKDLEEAYILHFGFEYEGNKVITHNGERICCAGLLRQQKIFSKKENEELGHDKYLVMQRNVAARQFHMNYIKELKQ